MDLRALLTAFGLIFIAELPDKTAYTVLLLAARLRPLPVLLGAWSAFVAQGAVAFVAGSLLAKLPPMAVALAAAAIFLFFGLTLLFGHEEEEGGEPVAPRNAWFSTFALVFLAEMGDATQVGSAALVAGSRAPWSTILGATLALCTVSALAVTVGSLLGPRLPRKQLRRIAGVLFCVFGLLSLARAFWRG